jgi:hypothetical protein
LNLELLTWNLEPGTIPDNSQLKQLQSLVWKLITAPEGVKKGLADLAAKGDPAPEQLRAWIVSDHKLSAEGRLDVYANMYFYRLKDALLSDFPKVAKIVGDDRFHNLVTDFLLVHPSKHWSLRYLGEPFPGFLKGHRESQEFPWLPDLAALEWAWGDAFQAENSPVLDRESLAALGPDQWADVRFQLALGVHLVEAAWDLDALWEDTALVPAQKRQALLVYREDDMAAFHVVPDEDVPALKALLAGKTFAEVCEAALQSDDMDASAQHAARILGELFAKGLVSSYKV